jgi:flagellar hook-basal body complex protein FliE
MMAIAPIGHITSAVGAATSGAGKAEGTGFGDAIAKGIEGVSNQQKAADSALTSFASGGSVQISDVMAATSKATLGMQVMVELRNRALEAYQQIMNIQV